MTGGPVAAGATVRANAWTGEDVEGPFGEYGRWTREAFAAGQQQLVPAPADPADWRDPRIGWGVVLPERPGLDPAVLATAEDAPEPVRDLVRRRGGKVLRYRSGGGVASWLLRDYAGGGDLLNAASPPGSGPRQLPMYLLICASPEQVPWSVQYELNPVRHVGRLDLPEEGLAHYVAALLSDDWEGSTARYDAPLVWSVDHGGGDITTLMRRVVGDTVWARLEADTDMPHALHLDEAGATSGRLVDALADARPALVVTTSHGMTGPLDDAGLMRRQLGLLVDQDRTVLAPDTLLGAWQPDGAVWVAHACCSAGSDRPSAYDGLFAGDSLVAQVLTAVAGLGATTSPLPAALLGAPRPLRAFVGQVEPTFDWTLSFPANQQLLTAELVAAVYDGICGGRPVGLAMRDFYRPVGSLLLGHGRALKQYAVASGAEATGSLDMALYSKVTAYDRASTVVLGDPTVSLPLPR